MQTPFSAQQTSNYQRNSNTMICASKTKGENQSQDFGILCFQFYLHYLAVEKDITTIFGLASKILHPRVTNRNLIFYNLSLIYYSASENKSDNKRGREGLGQCIKGNGGGALRIADMIKLDAKKENKSCTKLRMYLLREHDNDRHWLQQHPFASSSRRSPPLSVQSPESSDFVVTDLGDSFPDFPGEPTTTSGEETTRSVSTKYSRKINRQQLRFEPIFTCNDVKEFGTTKLHRTVKTVLQTPIAAT